MNHWPLKALTSGSSPSIQSFTACSDSREGWEQTAVKDYVSIPVVFLPTSFPLSFLLLREEKKKGRKRTRLLKL
jgi:hypothetical protein